MEAKFDIDDKQWSHDHLVDPRGYLYKNNTIQTFDGGIEYGSFSDFD